MAANHIHAVKYMECSAESGQNVKEVFETAIRIVSIIRLSNEAMVQEQSRKASGLRQLV